MSFRKISVECYSGHKVNERPVAFTYQGRRHEIKEIIDRWYEGGLDPTHPATDYYKVRTTENELFLLRYLSLFDAWSIKPCLH